MAKENVKTKLSPKKLVLDARFVGPNMHGFARYFLSLINGLVSLPNKNYEITILVTPEVALSPSDYGLIKSPEIQYVAVSIPFLSKFEFLLLPLFLKKVGASLFHSPTFSSCLPLLMPCPWVITVHDLNHLHFGHFFQKLYYQFLLKPFAKKSVSVVTVSEFSKHEIQDWLKIDSVKVAYNGIEVKPLEGLNDQSQIAYLSKRQLKSGQYVLVLAGNKEHKNLKTVIDAFQKFRLTSTGSELPLSLVIASLPPENKGHDLAANIQFIGPTAEHETLILMQHAAALFSPSLYEGFGLPPVEAAALGVPVVASAIPPHREGLALLDSDEVFWANPLDVQSWVDAFIAVSQKKVAPTSLVTRQKIKNQFSGQKSAILMDQIYRQAMGI